MADTLLPTPLDEDSNSFDLFGKTKWLQYMNIVGTVFKWRRLSHRFHCCVLTSPGKLVFNQHEILPKTASLMHCIQCYMYSYVIKLFKLTLSKIFFLPRFTNRFRGMMKVLRICFPLRPCLIHDRHSVCFIMERQIYNVTHAFFFLAFHSKEPSFCLSHFVYYRLLPSWSYWTSNITVILNGRFIEDVFISRQMPV